MLVIVESHTPTHRRTFWFVYKKNMCVYFCWLLKERNKDTKTHSYFHLCCAWALNTVSQICGIFAFVRCLFKDDYKISFLNLQMPASARITSICTTFWGGLVKTYDSKILTCSGRPYAVPLATGSDFFCQMIEFWVYVPRVISKNGGCFPPARVGITFFDWKLNGARSKGQSF